ncbi:hypothetical protein KEM48_005233 [Puccinia striiformis f. sp. tritici PST-130]|nr:hypothetical protein KEM48_005233 [Puccinia striiformis f. sp. tritici PST-130]
MENLLKASTISRSECQKDVVHSPIGHTSPPATQDTAGVPPDPAGSSTSASLTSTGLELNWTRNSDQSGPSSSTAPDVNPSSLSQPGSNSTGPVGVTNHPDGLAPPPPPPPSSFSSRPHPRIQMPTPLPLRIQTPPPPPLHPAQAEVHTILETFQGHLNRQKFNQAYLAVHAFIDCRAKTMHKRTPPPELPQFALVQSESSHSAWLKDIQNIDHAVKPSSLSDLNNDNLDSHLRILEYLNSCKTSSSPSNPEDGKLRNDMTLKPLYQLHDLIIDIFITYSIIRGSAVADVEPDATSAESQALVVQKKELDKHRSRHNYTPFCLYLVAGVRGLIWLLPTGSSHPGHRL